MKIVFILSVWIVLESMRMSGIYRKIAVVVFFQRNALMRKRNYDFAGRV